MDKIEKIRQEIERRRQAIRVLNEHTAPDQTSKTCAIFQYSDTILSELISFLDTLSEEPNKSLEEAADEYADSIEGQEAFSYGADHYCWEDVHNSFIAGAEWQEEQGESFESTAMVNAMGDSYVDGYYLTEKIPEGTKVIVQIRKKKEE